MRRLIWAALGAAILTVGLYAQQGPGPIVPTGASIAPSTVSIADGIGTSPSLFFTSDAGNSMSGLYKPTTNYLGFAAGGTPILALNNDGGGTQGLRLRSDDQLGFSSSTSLTSSNDIQMTRGGANRLRFGGATTGVELNTATATIGACGTGAVTAGSRGSAGEATATGSTTCAVNFGTSFANIPFVSCSDETTTGGCKITATSVSGFTATVTSGDKFTWTAIGFF